MTRILIKLIQLDFIKAIQFLVKVILTKWFVGSTNHWAPTTTVAVCWPAYGCSLSEAECLPCVCPPAILVQTQASLALLTSLCPLSWVLRPSPSSLLEADWVEKGKKKARRQWKKGKGNPHDLPFLTPFHSRAALGSGLEEMGEGQEDKRKGTLESHSILPLPLPALTSTWEPAQPSLGPSAGEWTWRDLQGRDSLLPNPQLPAQSTNDLSEHSAL